MVHPAFNSLTAGDESESCDRNRAGGPQLNAPKGEYALTAKQEVWCPHHPKDASWWWSSRCSTCDLAQTYCLSQSSYHAKELSGNPELDSSYRFARWPVVCAYTASRFRLPPESVVRESKTGKKSAKRRSRTMQRIPRLGSDTNPSSFTGGTLSIRRNALSLIGRHVDPSRTTNSSGDPWKC